MVEAYPRVDVPKSPGREGSDSAVGGRAFPKQAKLFVGALNAKTAMPAVNGITYAHHGFGGSGIEVVE
jgi:hypothetical protein